MMLVPVKNLGEPVLNLLVRLAVFFEEHGGRGYLVGGVVRDLLLGRAPAELDLTLERDATEAARELYAAWTGLFPDYPAISKPVIFKKYKTAKLRLAAPIGNGVEEIDLATTRSESYAHPGANPIVAPGDLRADIMRRDFSLNAMASALSADPVWPVIDLCSGLADLEARQLRILHPGSFQDDPARLIRAARFAVRFGFSIEPQTARKYGEAVSGNYLELLPPPRLFDEFRKALGENNIQALLERLSADLMLPRICAELTATDEAIAALDQNLARLAQSAGASARGWQNVLAALAANSEPRELEAFMRRCGQPEKDISRVLALHGSL